MPTIARNKRDTRKQQAMIRDRRQAAGRRLAALRPALQLLLQLLLQLTAGGSRALAIDHRRPNLSRLLESAGVGELAAGGRLSEEQVRLIRQISAIYLDEDELGERERALLESIGLGSVDAKSKLSLKVLFNNRLRNALKLERLEEGLRGLAGGPPEHQ